MKPIQVTMYVIDEREANICPHCNHVFTVDLYRWRKDELGGDCLELFVKDSCISYCPMCGKASTRRDVSKQGDKMKIVANKKR